MHSFILLQYSQNFKDALEKVMLIITVSGDACTTEKHVQQGNCRAKFKSGMLLKIGVN